MIGNDCQADSCYPRSMLEPAHLFSQPLQTLARWLDNTPLPSDSLYLVGGSIRNMLLGRPLKDLDLVCRNAKDFAVLLAQSRGAHCVPLGQDHDPPSFRVINPRDHEDFLDITELTGPNITADLARRDFTVNALAMGLADDRALIDPFNGHRDIRQGLLRRVGPSSLEHDPARILRGFRLRAQLDWDIAPETLQNMSAVASMLAKTAGERVASELRLILESSRAGRTIREMAQAKVLEVLFPEMTAMRGCAQNHFHRSDVFDHCLVALECCDTLLAEADAFFEELSANILVDLSGWRLFWLKLAVLLHDLGKPGTRGRHPRTGQITFYGHDALGAQMAQEAAHRLRLSRAEAAYISGLVRNHLHVGAILTPQATAKARMRLLRRLGPDVIPAVLLCLSDDLATLGPASSPECRRIKREHGLCLIRDSQGQAGAALSSPALLSGHDLIRMGLRPGPNLGRVLTAVREAQDAGEIKNRDQALNLAKKIAELPCKKYPC